MWSLQSDEMLISIPLVRWAIIYPYNMSRDVDQFIAELSKAALGLRFQLSQPIAYVRFIY